jgi:hypothetical protein
MLQNMQLMPMFGYYGGASLAESHSVSFILFYFIFCNKAFVEVDR